MTTKTVVLWKWKRTTTGHVLPSVCDYGARHVNTMCRMIRRNTTLPVRIVLITDDARGVTEADTVLPLPVAPMAAGGCYHRLYEFSAGFADYIDAPSFTRLDLDAVITGNIDRIIDRPEPFCINRYIYYGTPKQHYNGALLTMRCGHHASAWDRFRPDVDPIKINERKKLRQLVGSDQAWISHHLGAGQPVYGPDTGVHEAYVVEDELPDSACIVFFSGARDPSCSDYEWVKECWR